MKKLVAFLLFCAVNSHSYSESEILNTIYNVAINQGIKPEILYTIVKIESDFEPFAISFLTNRENAKYFSTLKSPNIDIKIGEYSLNRTKWVVAIKPVNEFYAKEITKLLVRDGYSVDVGLGQLNSANFDISEIENIFSPTYNLTKCAKVLRKCFEVKKKNIKDTIECYNYGMRKRPSNPYFNKFFKNYKNVFGNPY